MDGIIIILYALVLSLVFRPSKRELEKGKVEREVREENPMLNPEMIHDEHAFMRIANELGFH